MLSSTNKTKLAQVTEATRVLTFAGLPPHKNIKLDFLLAVIDSWDKQYNIYSNIKVDGNLISNEALLQNIHHSASTLTLEWFKQNDDEHDWDDSQTMTIINVAVKGIKHNPKVKNAIYDKTIHAYSNLNFTLDANVNSDIDRDSLTLNAYLDNGFPKASWRSFDPSIIIKSDWKAETKK